MFTKRCNDAYGYGCTNEMNYETEEELKAMFYFKKTRSGDFFQNTCKECCRKKHKEKYRNGKYNYAKFGDYISKRFSIGVIEHEHQVG